MVRLMAEWDIIPPPSSVTVEHEHRVHLFTADGTPLVRQAGFTSGGSYAPPVSHVPKAPSEVPRAQREGETR